MSLFKSKNTWTKLLLIALTLSLTLAACGTSPPETVVETVEVEKVVEKTVEVEKVVEKTVEVEVEVERTVQVEVEKEVVVTATPEPVVDRGKYGGVVRGACVSPTTSLDPQKSKMGMCDAIAYRALYDLLLLMTPTGEIESDLVTWEVSDDGLTYTFTLVRDDIVFHDGTPLDAEAVKVSIDRMRDPDSESSLAGNLSSIEAVNVVDPVTVEVVLSEPDVGLLAAFASQVGIPILSPTALEEYGDDDFQFNAVGSGPFKLVSWNVGDVAVFERNENYWQTDDEGNPLPYLDGFELNGIDDNTVRLLNLASGEFQINERIRPEDVPVVDTYEDLEVIETTKATGYAATFNTSQPPFDDPRVRKAVQYAIDDDGLIAAISSGTGYTLSWPVPKDAWYAPKVENPDRDIEKAKELLAEAGYPDGIDVILTHISRPEDAQIAQILQAQLAEAGINVTIQALERTGWLDIWLVGHNENTEGQMSVFQNNASPGDPGEKIMFLEPNGIVNFADWQNEEMWAAVEQSRQTLDQGERGDLWQSVYEANVEDAAYIWLGNVPVYVVTDKSVKGLELDAVAAWLLTQTWLED